MEDAYKRCDLRHLVGDMKREVSMLAVETMKDCVQIHKNKTFLLGNERQAA